MIVTCPGCASKYRVRNEAVPAEGARMRCPKCETLFLAKPPERGEASNDEFGGVPPTGSGAVPLNPSQPPQAPQAPRPAPSPANPAPMFGAPPSFAPPQQPPAALFAAAAPFGTSPAPAPFGAGGAPFGAPPAGPSPFGAASFGAPPPGPSPFGAPPPGPVSFGASPAPFGASSSTTSPSPFGPPPASSAPFGTPASSPSPFAAPSQPAPFGGGGSFGPAPSPPTSAPRGPLTAMMQTFDDSQLSGSSSSSSTAPSSTSAGRAHDDDPFARLDIGPATGSSSSLPSLSTSSPTLSPSSSSSSSSPAMSDRPRTSTQAPARAPTAVTSSSNSSASPPPARAIRGDSLPAAIGSWVALVASAAAAIFGLTFAGWTSESLDLDESMMPFFEESFGVRPPLSFLGADDVPLDELRRLAQAKERDGDLAGAVVAWRRVQARDPSDRTATTALPRVMSALGERLR